MSFIEGTFNKLIYDLGTFAEHNPTQAALFSVGSGIIVGVALIGIRKAVKWYGQKEEERFLNLKAFFDVENLTFPVTNVKTSTIKDVGLEEFLKLPCCKNDFLKVKRLNLNGINFANEDETEKGKQNFEALNALLPYLKNVEKISLQSAKFETLPENLKASNSKELDVSYNVKLQDFSNLPSGLEKLTIGHSQLENIPSLKNLYKIKTLDLIWNKLEKLDDLSNLPKNLEEIDISFNYLFNNELDCAALKKQCPKLQTLKIDAEAAKKLTNKETIPHIVITDEILSLVNKDSNALNQQNQ